MSDAKSKIARALMKDPEWEYGSILPIATRGPRKNEGETYGDISLALPDMIRDPLASWVKIRDQGFTNYDMADVLNVSGMMAPAGLMRGGAAKAAQASGARFPKGPSKEAMRAALDARDLEHAERIARLRQEAAAVDQADPRLARAREQGFNTEQMYYRTHHDPKRPDAFRLSPEHGTISITPDPALALQFGKNLFRNYIKDQDIFDPDNAAHVAKLAAEIRRQNIPVETGGASLEVYLRDTAPSWGHGFENPEMIGAMKGAGFRGFKSNEESARDSIGMLYPEDIRDVDAQFSPSAAGKNGRLLEGSSPVAAIIAALQGEDRR